MGLDEGSGHEGKEGTMKHKRYLRGGIQREKNYCNLDKQP